METIRAIHNPHQLSEVEFRQRFTVRTQLLDKLLKDILTTEKDQPPTHHIIQGQRGQGKTTLLRMISLRVRDNEKTADWLLPLLFNEEEYRITRLPRLWERIAEMLIEHPGFEGLQQTYDKLYEQPNYEQNSFDLLHAALEKADSCLLLLIDNIGDLLNKFKRKDIQHLREILSSTNRLRIVGASTVMLEQHFDHSQPFYQFFRMHVLEGLDKDDTKALLRTLGTDQQQARLKRILNTEPGRIEALRRLTSGVPRTIMLLFDILPDENGDAFRDLDLLLDRVTPLYKHRMDDLPTQQQEIVEEIALAWDAVAVKEIAERVHLPSRQVSAQLKQLVKNRIIFQQQTSTKNHLYRLDERFFNIWYLMRHGRAQDQKRALWLVRFLQTWCNAAERCERAESLVRSIHDGRLPPKDIILMTHALVAAGLEPETEQRLIAESRRTLPLEFQRSLPTSSVENKRIFQSATEAYLQQDYVKAESLLLPLVKNGDADAMYNLALLYEQHFERYEDAERFYLMAVGKDHAGAMNTLAALYHQHFERYEDAERLYLMAVGKDHAGAMNNLALLYQQHFERYEDAERLYLMAVEKDTAGAMYNLALLYEQHFEQYEDAERFYLMAVEKGHAGAMYNLALLYKRHFERYEDAERFYLMAVEKDDARAMNNLALLYFDQKRNAKVALELSQRAAKKGLEQAVLFQVILLLWNRQEKEAIEAFERIREGLDFDQSVGPISLVLGYFLAAGQTAYLQRLFEAERYQALRLKARFKPIYYALLHRLGETRADDARRMGPELEETVNEIREWADTTRKDYFSVKDA